MKYTIIIDDNTKAGAGLLEVARGIAKTYKTVKITKGITEDEWIASEIEKSKRSGEANRDDMLKRFNLK
jgi:hypothetical protein